MSNSQKYYLETAREDKQKTSFNLWFKSRLGNTPLKSYKEFIDKFGYTADAKLAIAISTLTEYDGLTFKDSDPAKESIFDCMFGLDFKMTEFFDNIQVWYESWIRKLYNISQNEVLSDIRINETLHRLGLENNIDSLAQYVDKIYNTTEILYSIALDPTVLTYFNLGLSTEELTNIIHTIYIGFKNEQKRSLQSKYIWAFVGQSLILSTSDRPRINVFQIL